MNCALQIALFLVSCAIFAAAADDVSFVPSLIPQIEERIINGQHALPNQFPWHVAITGVQQNSQRVLCGGALISANHVLTSAQCVQGPTFTYFVLNLGSTNFTRPLLTLEINPAHQNARIIHPQFNPTSNTNNIALLRLPIPVPTNQNTIAPIRLPTNGQQNTPFTDVIGDFTGHGRVANISPQSQALRFVQLRVIPLQQCAQYYGAVVANANVLCTVGQEFDAQGPCELDFGGPLVLHEANGQTLIGVQSFVSNQGCVVGQPAGFMRVGSVLPWINQNAGLSPRN